MKSLFGTVYCERKSEQWTMIFTTFLLPSVDGNALPGLRDICPFCTRFGQSLPLSVLSRTGALLPRCISQLKQQSCFMRCKLEERKSPFALQILSQQKTTYALRLSLMALPCMHNMLRI